MKGKHILITLCCALPFCLSAIVIAFDWKINPEAKVRFTARGLLGKKVLGTLTFGKHSVIFDTNNLQESSMYISIPVSSINTGNSARDKHLKKKDFFAADSFPDITFRSHTFNQIGPHSYEVWGFLKIKKTEKQISIPFTFTKSGSEGEFIGSFNINRMEYDLGSKYKRSIAQEVYIQLKVPVLQQELFGP